MESVNNSVWPELWGGGTNRSCGGLSQALQCPGAGDSPLQGLFPDHIFRSLSNCVTLATPLFLVFQSVMGLGHSFRPDQVASGRGKGDPRGVGALYMVPGIGHPSPCLVIILLPLSPVTVDLLGSLLPCPHPVPWWGSALKGPAVGSGRMKGGPLGTRAHSWSCPPCRRNFRSWLCPPQWPRASRS